MKPIIQQLHTLNSLDVKLQTVNKDLERLPRELELQKEEPQLLREQLERRNKEFAAMKEEGESLEEELKIGGQAIKRYQSQMHVLKTPKEFESVKRSLESQKQANGKLETQILENMQAMEEFQKESAEMQTRLEALDQAVAEESARVEKEVGELSAQKAELDIQRADLAKNLPEKELTIYNRIVINRGNAIATIDKGICQACYMQLPPQVHNLALIAADLTTCPSCGRILTAE